MDPRELEPLEAGFLPQPRNTKRSQGQGAPRTCYRGPLRLCRLLALVIVLPSLFVLIPLYLRYHVYSGQIYPMSMTDMRLIDSKISPTWCQRQVVRSNATFNAFVVPSQPQLTDELVPVSMTRELELEDDMKEYWGFYLLRGSSVTVSACVRWPGASLIMIKGYKHLQSCAYIGDDSSEELDELLDAHALGLLSNDTLIQKLQELKKVDGKANQPEAMKRHKPGVKFHDPNKKTNASSPDSVPSVDVTDHDPKELREILEHLHALRQAQKTESLKYYHPPSHLMSVPALHRHRDTNVDRDERRWLSFKYIDGNTSEQNQTTTNDTLEILIQRIKPKTNQIDNLNKDNVTNSTNKPLVKELIKDSNTITQENVTSAQTEALNSEDNENTLEDNLKGELEENKERLQVVVGNNDKKIEINTDASSKLSSNEIKIQLQEVLRNKANKMEVNTEPPGVMVKSEEVEIQTIVAETSYKPEDDPDASKHDNVKLVSEEQNSKEVFEDVLQRLQALGDRGKRVLVKLHETMGVSYKEKQSNERIMSAVHGSEEELDRLRRVLVEAIDEEKTRAQRQQKRRDAVSDARAKRELMLGQADFQRELNEDDEPRNLAAEEGLDPDGYAEDHVQLNETTAFDMSNSEFWSSFSSSEEALLECEGLILNLPLTPHSACHADATEEQTLLAARSNALTYRVPANGYYFFVFNSENEVQRNYIRARFQLQKTRYDVARTLHRCTNSSARCDLPLDIFSSQRVVLEVPLRDNDSLWNEQFVIISECEPRTSIYLFCVLAVPILILVFAFQ